MFRASTLSTADLPPPSARRVPRSRRGDGWDALADIEVFVFAVVAELESMERERVGVHRRGRKPDLALRRRLIGLIWTLTFGGMQWRGAGWASAWPSIGASPAATKSCRRRWWPTAVRSARLRALGRGASMAASWSQKGFQRRRHLRRIPASHPSLAAPPA